VIREFVVGTGGKELRTLGAIKPHSKVRNADTFGVLKLTLQPTCYKWKFVPVAGKSFTDSGSGECHLLLRSSKAINKRSSTMPMRSRLPLSEVHMTP